MDIQKTISVEAVSAIKKNKKGGEFISVKDGAGVWWYVGAKKLFPLFTKGESVECLVSRENDFNKIIDAMVDGSPTIGGKSSPSPKNEQAEAILQRLDEILTIVEDIKRAQNPLN